MALVKGTNSYATVAEANAYFADRLDVDAWGSDDVRKAQALVTATGILDGQTWTGIAIDEEQPLAFPRSGSYYDPKLGIWVELSSEVPSRIETATIELAYHLLNNNGLLDDTGRVNNIGLSSIRLDNVTSPNLIPSVVKRLIKPLLENQGSNSWWRAN
jgi:hypothetical protein